MKRREDAAFEFAKRVAAQTGWGTSASTTRRVVPPIGPFQSVVLEAVAALKEEGACGVSITAWLNDASLQERKVVPAQVYGALNALISERLVEHLPNEKRTASTGRPRVCYALTSRGRLVLEFARALVEVE